MSYYTLLLVYIILGGRGHVLRDLERQRLPLVAKLPLGRAPSATSPRLEVWSACVCVCIYVLYIYIYIYMYTHTYVHMYMYIYIVLIHY